MVAQQVVQAGQCDFVGLLGKTQVVMERGADPASGTRVGEQRALQRLVGGAVATIPLGCDGEVYAALCIERDGDSPDSEALSSQEVLLASYLAEAKAD